MNDYLLPTESPQFYHILGFFPMIYQRSHVITKLLRLKREIEIQSLYLKHKLLI
jgi:hypothetical protein